MRVRGMGVPLAFGLLGAAFPLPLEVHPILVSSLGELGFMGLVSGVVTATSATVMLLLVAGESPTKRRGALSAVLAVIVAALVSAPVVAIIPIVKFSIEEGPVILWWVGGFVLVFVLVSLVLSVPAAFLGWVVASRPSLWPDADVVSFSAHPDQTYRRLRFFCGLVVCLAVLIGAVQYTDPVLGNAGPPELDPTAPPETQINQAVSQTCTRSFVATGTVYHKERGQNTSEPWKLEDIRKYRVIRNPEEQFQMRTTKDAENNESGFTVLHTVLWTDEVAWRWDSNQTNPPQENISPVRIQRRVYPANELVCSIGGDKNITSASVVSESADQITVTSQFSTGVNRPGRWVFPRQKTYDATFVINKTSGRIQTIRAVSIYEDRHDPILKKESNSYQFSYEGARIRRPSLPPRPHDLRLSDLLNGPVFRIPS